MKGREVQEYKALVQIDIRVLDIIDLPAQDMVQNITAQDMD